MRVQPEGFTVGFIKITSMDASILLVGDQDFCKALMPVVCDRVPCTLETVANPAEAIPLIYAQQPDLLLIQASQATSLDLCTQLKSHSRIAWIHCILIGKDDRHNPDTDLGSMASVPFDDQRLATELLALESGADVYLWRSPVDLSCQTSSFTPEALAATDPVFEGRLIAHINAGLRRVHNHRELMRTNDLLSTIALSDPLTELNNRRALEWELPRQIQNAHQRDLPISLLVLDVDFFKTINDNHGHLIGDRALQLISSRLKHNLRFCDTPFRYGGEEFVVILNDTDCEDAHLVAQRICHLIADQPFAVSETLDLNITISAGTATLRPEDDERGISLLDRADHNLLRAKSQGRNRVISSSDRHRADSNSSHHPPKTSAPEEAHLNSAMSSASAPSPYAPSLLDPNSMAMTPFDQFLPEDRNSPLSEPKSA